MHFFFPTQRCTGRSVMMSVSNACRFTENDTRHQEAQQLFCQQKNTQNHSFLQKAEHTRRARLPPKSLIQPVGITVCQKVKPLTMTRCS